MEVSDIIPFALGERNRGFLNQILGAFKALSELTGQSYEVNKLFVLPEGVSDVNDLKEAIFTLNIMIILLFATKFLSCLTLILKNVILFPRCL